MSLGILALFIALLAWGLFAQRDLRREIQEIYSNVLLPFGHWWAVAGARIATVRFGIHHLFALTTTVAVFFGLVHYMGIWAIAIVPLLGFIALKLYQRKAEKHVIRFTLVDLVVASVVCVVLAGIGDSVWQAVLAEQEELRAGIQR